MSGTEYPISKIYYCTVCTPTFSTAPGVNSHVPALTQALLVLTPQGCEGTNPKFIQSFSPLYLWLIDQNMGSSNFSLFNFWSHMFKNACFLRLHLRSSSSEPIYWNYYTGNILSQFSHIYITHLDYHLL